MDTRKSSAARRIVSTILVLCMSVPHATRDTFKCSGDICNRGSQDQFCSSYFKYCRNCADIVDDCGTNMQPINCTAHCTAYKVGLELQKIKESTCSAPRDPAHGLIVPQSDIDGRFSTGINITITCEDGYTLVGARTMACLGNDTWTGDKTPFCLDNSYILWQNVGKVLVISVLTVAVTVTAIIVISWRIYKSRQKPTNIGPHTRANSASLAESGIDLSVIEQDETSLLMKEECLQTYQQLKMEDKCVGTDTDQTESIPQDDTNSTRQSDTNTSSSSRNTGNECDQFPKLQPIASTVNVHVTLRSPMNTNAEENGNVRHKSDVTEKTSTKESNITIEAKQETAEKSSCKGTKPLPRRTDSDASPKAGATTRTAAFFAPDTKETMNTEPRVVGLNDRTFLASEAQKQ